MNTYSCNTLDMGKGKRVARCNRGMTVTLDIVAKIVANDGSATRDGSAGKLGKVTEGDKDEILNNDN